MQYIDERVVFNFNNIISTWTEGIFRYDVILDDDVIFVGNIYVESTTPPKIDITDILRNYYQSNYDIIPSAFSTINNSIVREVTVVLYNRDKTDEESITDDIYFIYRQPNYNSEVTTPILDYKNAAGIESMPMLQGWDYLTNTGYFIPTYPKVASDIFTCDFVTANGQTNHNMQITSYYNDGTSSISHYKFNLSNNIYNLGMKLSELVKESTMYVEKQVRIDDLFSLPTDNSWIGGTSSDGMKFKAQYIGKFMSGFTFTSANLKHCNSTFSWGSGVTDGNITTWENNVNYGTSSPFSSFSYCDATIRLEGSDGSIFSVTFPINSNKRSELFKNHNNYYTVKYTVTFNSSKCILSFEAIAIGKVEKYYSTCEIDCVRVKVYDGSGGSEYKYNIFKFDGQSRYFLKWRDRYGMPQCQPFKGTYTYSENTTKSNIINYQNIKKLVDVNVTSSWKLNTDWISEKYYPFYESIFVSPWLQLYDAKEDKLYSVILTNTEYTEKTFKNQNRSLFNLELEVELDKSQNIIY